MEIQHVLGIEPLSRIPQVYTPVLSNSGEKVAFYWDRSGTLELYVVDIRSRKVRQISRGECPREIAGETQQLCWTLDDKSLVYAGPGNRNLFRLEIETGKVVQILDAPKSLAFPLGPASHRHIITILVRPEGSNIFRIDLDTREALQLTNHISNILDAGKPNPGAALVAYTTSEPDDPLDMHVWLVGADGNEQREVVHTRPHCMDYVSSWSRDGKSVTYTTDAHGVEQAGIYSTLSGETRLLGDAKFEEMHPTFTSHDRNLVVLRNQDARIFPVLYDLSTGVSERLDFPSGVVRDPQSVFDDQSMIFRISTPTQPSHLVSYSLESRKLSVIIPPEYGSVDPLLLAEPRHVKYTSFDGTEIPAILYEPKSQGKHPALIEVHRGPDWQHFMFFNIFAQAIVSQGYVLLQPNIRGSTGYGRQFREKNIGDWGGGDLNDAIKGAEYLRSLPEVDARRVGIWGMKYGGYISLLALVKSASLNAGCAISGISHLKTLYDHTVEDNRFRLRMFMGSPEENSKLWDDRSPLVFIQDLQSPLLLIHPVNDHDIPVEESRQVRSKLIDLGRIEGKDFEYVELDQGASAYSNPEARRRLIKLIATFFNNKMSPNQ